MTHMQIGIFGGTSTQHEDVLALARETGREIAKRQATLLCGNVQGVLGAALEGAKEQGGTTVVIAPTDKKENHDFVDIYVASSQNWFSRGPALANSLDGIVVIGGGVGTLTELSYAWWQEIPLVVLKTGELTDRYIGMTFDKRKSHVVEGADTPKDAVEKLFSMIH